MMHSPRNKASSRSMIIKLTKGYNAIVDKDNLRMCTQHENQANRKVRKDSGWQIKGVHFHKRDKLFSARIIVNGKQIHLGYAKTPEKVHELYANAANRYFGAFARA